MSVHSRTPARRLNRGDDHEPVASVYVAKQASVPADARDEPVIQARTEKARAEQAADAYQTDTPDRPVESEKALVEDVPQKSDEPPRKGWWQKRFGGA